MNIEKPSNDKVIYHFKPKEVELMFQKIAKYLETADTHESQVAQAIYESLQGSTALSMELRSDMLVLSEILRINVDQPISR